MTARLLILAVLGSLALLVAAVLPAHAAKRVALVIGNDAYAQVPKLKKAVNDARTIGETLKGLGFEVTVAENLARRDMNRQLQGFASRLDVGDEALFFFAGHGVEIAGRNYLLPTDIPGARPGQEDFVRAEAVPVDSVLDMIRRRGTRVSILVLDACRDNPFPRAGTRSLGRSRGLARMPAPEGTFIMYSAGVGQTALDRLSESDANPNSVFTRSLVPLMQKPGVSLVQAARAVRRDVQKLASSISHDQRPAYYDEVTGDFFFAGRGPATGGGSAAPAPEAGQLAALQQKLKALEERLKAGTERKNKETEVAVGVFPKAIKPSAGSKFQRGYEFQECDDCPKMVVVPSGSFMMEPPKTEKDGKEKGGLPRKITINKPFAVGKFEVTRAQFDAFIREAGYDAGSNCWTYENGSWLGRSDRSYRNPGFAQKNNHPASCINDNDAKAYTRWLSKKTGKQYRLLWEAEWEFAARGGRSTPLLTGRNENAARINRLNFSEYHQSKIRATIAVDSHEENAFGLFAMYDNVTEHLGRCIDNDCGNYGERAGPSWALGLEDKLLEAIVYDGMASSRGHQFRTSYMGFRVARDLTDAELGLAKKSEAPKPETKVAVGVYPQKKASAPTRILKRGDEFQDCEQCPKMVVVPAGSVRLGSPASEPGYSYIEGPRPKITFSRPFAVGKFEVIFDEWDACVARVGCNGHRPEDEGWGRGRQPVINVSWKDAKAYVAWLSKKTGQQYRLLSETEWEYVAKAGTTTPFSTGNTITTDQANFNGNETYNSSSYGQFRRKTVVVGSFQANNFGLHDLHGNAAEWVEDCEHSDFTNSPKDGSADTSGRCTWRILRGGSWKDRPDQVRSAVRDSWFHVNEDATRGFRVARDLTDAELGK